MSDSFSKLDKALNEILETTMDKKLTDIYGKVDSLKNQLNDLVKNYQQLDGNAKVFKSERENIESKVHKLMESVSVLNDYNEKMTAKKEELAQLQKHVTDIEHDVSLMVTNDVDEVATLQKEVDSLSSRLSETENTAKEIREKIDKLTTSLSRHTELRRSLRGI